MQYNGLKHFAKRCKNIYCYGIGKWGELVAKYCKKNRIEIKAYIISGDRNEQKEFYGKPIVHLSQLKIDKQDGFVLATERSDYKNDMLNELKKYRQRDYII